VGVSWYEATAYATWLTGVLRRARAGDAGLAAEDLALVVDLLERGGAEIRLSTEDEWRRMAGGTEAKDRYPWDPPKGPATKDKKEIVARCNVSESRIGRTSPVGMYPLGESRPHHLRDLGGNVWEWTQTEEGGVRVLVGGSWAYFTVDARCASRLRNTPRASRTTTSGCGSSPPLFLVPDSWVSDF
jgi:formylglycine-generating enzyme required for sulfatase activity